MPNADRGLRRADVVQRTYEPYRSGLAGRIALEVRVPENLPALDVDRTLLGRAFTNIIENALHAMPGAGTLHVVVSRPSSVVSQEPSVDPPADFHARRRRHCV